MAPNQVQPEPSLATFIKSLNGADVERSIENYISLLKRRQIRNSRPCALATAQLLLRVVVSAKVRDATSLIERVRSVGRRLVAAQPREMAVGNIVRRVLGLIREVVEENAPSDAADDAASSSFPSPKKHDSLHRPGLTSHISTFSPLKHGVPVPHEHYTSQDASRSSSVSAAQDHKAGDFGARPLLFSTATSTAGMHSLFGLLSTPENNSPSQTPPIGSTSPVRSPSLAPRQIANLPDTKLDVKAEVIDCIKELLDELEVVDDQIAAYALEHIHSSEIILTHTSSQTVQRFLLTAARKRKFTVVHVEAYPNNHEETHDTIMRGHKKSDVDSDESSERWKALINMGINVIMIPDSAVFALMSRVNKVVLAPHSVLANGSLIAAAGAQTIARAAKVHQTPVVVLSGVYKLSPVYPFDTEDLIEWGDPGNVVGFDDTELVDKVEVINPLYDYVPSELVDLYITNLGGHAPSYLYRIVADHYRVEDINLS